MWHTTPALWCPEHQASARPCKARAGPSCINTHSGEAQAVSKAAWGDVEMAAVRQVARCAVRQVVRSSAAFCYRNLTTERPSRVPKRHGQSTQAPGGGCFLPEASGCDNPQKSNCFICLQQAWLLSRAAWRCQGLLSASSRWRQRTAPSGRMLLDPSRTKSVASCTWAVHSCPPPCCFPETWI